MMGSAEFANRAPIHPDSVADYQIWEQLLRKWNARINLVAPDSLPDFWARHALDSAQMLPLLTDRDRIIVDFGSGAGFPALAIAIQSKHDQIDRHVHLIESVGKKASFLKSVSRETRLRTSVHAKRIEAMESLNADLITARAFAPLRRLLPMAAHHLRSEGRLLLLKGARVTDEILDAKQDWRFATVSHVSQTDSDATILEIRNLRPI